MHMLCQHPACVNAACLEVIAEGTSFSYLVCSTDASWAKRELSKDFPGRRIQAKRFSSY
ncbi:hypothetical protein ACTFTM_15235 [Micromonospora sp. RB23]